MRICWYDVCHYIVTDHFAVTSQVTKNAISRTFLKRVFRIVWSCLKSHSCVDCTIGKVSQRATCWKKNRRESSIFKRVRPLWKVIFYRKSGKRKHRRPFLELYLCTRSSQGLALCFQNAAKDLSIFQRIIHQYSPTSRLAIMQQVIQMWFSYPYFDYCSAPFSATVVSDVCGKG